MRTSCSPFLSADDSIMDPALRAESRRRASSDLRSLMPWLVFDPEVSVGKGTGKGQLFICLLHLQRYLAIFVHGTCTWPFDDGVRGQPPCAKELLSGHCVVRHNNLPKRATKPVRHSALGDPSSSSTSSFLLVEVIFPLGGSSTVGGVY